MPQYVDGLKGIEKKVEGEPQKSKAQLTYWDGHGNAEIIRLTMAVCGQEWEDVVPFDEDGATHLSKREQLDKMMKAGVLMSDQVPLLRIDGLNIVQKMAAVRYLARKHGLYGKDNAEATQIDIVAETLLDYAGKDHEKYLPRLERAMGGGKFFMGDSISFVDVMFFKIVDDNGLLDQLPPGLKASHEAVRDYEPLKAYLASEKRFPRLGTEGYMDRVKAVLSHMTFAGGDGKSPPIACDTWNFKD